MKDFFKFMSSKIGRVTRVVAGALIIFYAYSNFTGNIFYISIVIGLIPFTAGLFDWCFFAPLFGKPFVGEKLRNKLGK